MADDTGQGEAVRVLAAMLRVNKTLNNLDISSNSLGPEAGDALQILLASPLGGTQRPHGPGEGDKILNWPRERWQGVVLSHGDGTHVR